MDLLTVKQASEYLGVSTMTIRRYLKAGKLQGLQYSRDIRIEKQSLEKFIEESKIGGNENDERTEK